MYTRVIPVVRCGCDRAWRGDVGAGVRLAAAVASPRTAVSVTHRLNVSVVCRATALNNAIRASHVLDMFLNREKCFDNIEHLFTANKPTNMYM